MKYKIYDDLHIGSPIEMLRNEISAEPAHENTILIGDIVDGANCLKSELDKNRSFLEMLLRIHKHNYVFGNHERMGSSLKNCVIKTNESGKRIVFAHGDLESNPDKWIEYRSREWGAGLFKRTFIVPFIREAEEILNRKPKKDFLKRAADLAKLNNCTTYVCGHFHPKEIVDVSFDGVHIIILKRGMTEIEI